MRKVLETICIKCQILFSERNHERKRKQAKNKQANKNKTNEACFRSVCVSVGGGVGWAGCDEGGRGEGLGTGWGGGVV